MSARSGCIRPQPRKLGAGRDSWLIINISTARTAGENRRGGGKEALCNIGDEAV